MLIKLKIYYFLLTHHPLFISKLYYFIFFYYLLHYLYNFHLLIIFLHGNYSTNNVEEDNKIYFIINNIMTFPQIHLSTSWKCHIINPKI